MKPIIINMTLFVLLLYSSNTMSQCLEIRNTPPGGYGSIFNESCIKFLPSQKNIIFNQTDGTWEYLSPEIYIKPIDGTNGSFVAKGASNASTGNFHLSSFRNDLHITSNPADNVEKDHLFEISFTDNQNMNQLHDTYQKINSFLIDTTGKYKPSYDPNSDYVKGFNDGTIVNPYDPDHISVDGIFWRPGTNSYPMIKYGFYYKKFIDTNNVWVLDPNNVDNWKIRFAPDEVGTWYYNVCVWVGNRLIAQSGLKSFTVTPTNDPGYVKVANDPGENKQYLKFSNNNETFFPIGNNYAFGAWDGTPRSDLFEMKQAMDKIAGSPGNPGGNSTRLMFSTWSLHIEWEKLNNYDNRQEDLYAIDEYLRYLESKNIYLTLSILGQDEFAYFKGSDCDWKWNPYHDTINLFKGVHGVDSVYKFYTDETARKIFKKRLRYINARWGYSPHLMLYELQSEIGNTGLFWTYVINQNDKAINWFNEMAGYLKETLKCKQLTSVSNGGEGLKWQKNPLLIQPMLDVVLPHFYYSRETAVKLTYDALDTISIFLADFNAMKPIFIQECGVLGYLDEVTFCTDLEFHKRNWAYNFIGSSGVLWWDFAYLHPTSMWFPNPASFEDSIGKKLYESEYYKNFPGIRSFFSNLNLKTKNYIRYHAYGPTTSDPWYETGYSISTDKSLVFGWFRNRSSNLFNCDDCINTFYYGKYHENNNPPNIIVDNINDIWKDACDDTSKGAYKEFWCQNWPVTISTWWKPYYPHDSISCIFNSDYMPSITDNPGDDNYNMAFHVGLGYPTATNVKDKHIGNLMIGKGLQPITISGLESGTYNVQWYWTWDDRNATLNRNTAAGSPYIGDEYIRSSSVNGLQTINGTITFNAPPTVRYGSKLIQAPVVPPSQYGKPYPGEWAYIIRKDDNGGSINQKEKPINQVNDIGISVEPNPTTGMVSVKSTNLEVPYTMYLFNGQGSLVRTIADINTNNLQIDMTNLPGGIYHLTLKNNNCSKTVKIVKM